MKRTIITPGMTVTCFHAKQLDTMNMDGVVFEGQVALSYERFRQIMRIPGNDLGKAKELIDTLPRITEPEFKQLTK